MGRETRLTREGSPLAQASCAITSTFARASMPPNGRAHRRLVNLAGMGTGIASKNVMGLAQPVKQANWKKPYSVAPVAQPEPRSAGHDRHSLFWIARNEPGKSHAQIH